VEHDAVSLAAFTTKQFSASIGWAVHLASGFPISLPWWSFAIGLGFSAAVAAISPRFGGDIATPPLVESNDVAASPRGEPKRKENPLMNISLNAIASLGASLVRYVRASVLDVIRLDYVTTARSKGIGERKVITKHVVRNALIPVVTLVALQLPCA